MAPSDSTRVVICIIALAGVGLAFLLLRKYRRPKKPNKSRLAETSGGCQEETLTKQTTSGSESVQTYSGHGASREVGDAVTSPQKLLASEKCNLSTSRAAIDAETKEEPFAVQDVNSVPSVSACDTETTEDFLTAKEASPTSSTVACVEIKEELLVSKESKLNGEDSFVNVDSQLAKSVEAENVVAGLLPVGQGTEVSGSAEENAFGPTAESGDNEDVPYDFAEEDQDADAEGELGADGDRPAAAPVVANEDKDSLQSNDVTNSDAQSFERISSYNEVTSLGESGQNETGNNGQLPADTGSTFPAFIIDAVRRPFNVENAGGDDETVSSLSFGPVDSSKDVTPASEAEEEETDVTLNEGSNDTEEIQEIQENYNSLPSSFEPLSLTLEDQRSVSFGPVSSSIEVIQSADFAGDQMSHASKTSAFVDHTSFSTGPEEKLGNLLGSIEIIQPSVNSAVMGDAPETTAASLLNSDTTCSVSQDSTRADNSMTSIEIIQPPSLDVNSADIPDKLPSLKTVSSDDLSNVQETSVEGADNSRSSVKVIQKSASESDSADDIRSASVDARSKMSSPSNESFQSLEQFDGSTTSGSRQDFFSLSNSPELGEETLLDSISSNDQREEKKRLASLSDSTSFDTDLDFTTATESPPERTPTNTPTLEMAAENPVDDEQKSLESSSDGVMDGKEQKSENFGAKTPTTQLTQKAQWMLGIDKNKITEAIEKAQSNPDKMEIGHLQILVEMLKQEDLIVDMLDTAIQCIIRVSAFTTNVEVLRVCQCPLQLTHLLQKFAPSVSKGEESKDEKLLLNIARAINNLAMDLKSQSQLEGSIPVLTNLLLTEGISEDVTIASLQPLTNLSTSPAYHKHYTSIVQQLYAFLDTSHNTALRLQCLKVLVNLSLNSEIVPHLLAAKAPECLLELLDVNSSYDLLLRAVTFVANIMSIMKENELTASSLPPDHKAPSPETLYSALFALDTRDVLRNKVFRLTRHQSQDVAYQATRLYNCITTLK